MEAFKDVKEETKGVMRVNDGAELRSAPLPAADSVEMADRVAATRRVQGAGGHASPAPESESESESGPDAGSGVDSLESRQGSGTQTGWGRLYGLSLGPGDPGLITRQVWAHLQGGHGPARWTYPVRRQGSRSHALEIVLRAGLPVPEDALALVFPMTHDRAILARYWQAAAEQVVQVLATGRDVCFLVEGDASTYSTFTHLARSVTALAAGVRIETLAGVSAYHAAAARLEMPLVDTDDAMAIIPAAYGIETIEALLGRFDTLVLLKVKPLLDEVIDLLERRGLLPHARFVEKLGTPEERTVHEVACLRGATVNYLSLLLVHNPARERGALLKGCRSRSRGRAGEADSAGTDVLRPDMPDMPGMPNMLAVPDRLAALALPPVLYTPDRGLEDLEGLQGLQGLEGRP